MAKIIVSQSAGKVEFKKVPPGIYIIPSNQPSLDDLEAESLIEESPSTKEQLLALYKEENEEDMPRPVADMLHGLVYYITCANFGYTFFFSDMPKLYLKPDFKYNTGVEVKERAIVLIVTEK